MTQELKIQKPEYLSEDVIAKLGDERGDETIRMMAAPDGGVHTWNSKDDPEVAYEDAKKDGYVDRPHFGDTFSAVYRWPLIRDLWNAFASKNHRIDTINQLCQVIGKQDRINLKEDIEVFDKLVYHGYTFRLHMPAKITICNRPRHIKINKETFEYLAKSPEERKTSYEDMKKRAEDEGWREEPSA